jgi:hypothetical protein
MSRFAFAALVIAPLYFAIGTTPAAAFGWCEDRAYGYTSAPYAYRPRAYYGYTSAPYYRPRAYYGGVWRGYGYRAGWRGYGYRAGWRGGHRVGWRGRGWRR